MTYDLTGRAAIVTGASQGLGLAIAKADAAAGASVAICARDRNALAEAEKQIGAKRLIADVADVAKEDDVTRFAKRAIDEFGRVDILVNNAGIYGPLGSIESIDWAEWVRAIEINLMGSVLFCRALLPHFK